MSEDTLKIDPLADFLKKEPLCAELAPYLEDGEHFQMLRHPLVYSVPYSEALNASLNKQLIYKKEAIEKALQEKNWGSFFFLHERPYRIHRFIQHIHQIDREKRWEIFGQLWIDSENLSPAIPVIKMLLRTDPTGCHKMMDDEEREFLSKLPDTFKIYRGHKRNNKFGFCWTLSPGVAQFFAYRFEKDGHVIEAICSKKDVIAVLLGRGEMEVVIDPRNLKAKRTKPFKRTKKFTDSYQLAVEVFKLKLNKSQHGPSHWDRVEQNAIDICKEYKEADLKVCRLFAIFHDSCREDENIDKDHGRRAATFVKELYDKDKLAITKKQLNLLVEACAGHNDGKTSDNPTIGVCWDADRLDLLRVGITPDPKYFSTEAGKKLIWR